MKRVLACLAILALSAFVTVSSFADDAPKKKKGANGGKGKAHPALTQAMKALEAANLTDEQKAKITEMAGKLKEQTAALSSEGLTDELSKKHTGLLKAAREAGKKAKELEAAGNEGFSETEVAVLKKASLLQAKFRKDILGLLTDEQKAALPAELVKFWSGPEKGKGGGKGGKKKDAS